MRGGISEGGEGAGEVTRAIALSDFATNFFPFTPANQSEVGLEQVEKRIMRLPWGGDGGGELGGGDW